MAGGHDGRVLEDDVLWGRTLAREADCGRQTADGSRQSKNDLQDGTVLSKAERRATCINNLLERNADEPQRISDEFGVACESEGSVRTEKEV